MPDLKPTVPQAPKKNHTTRNSVIVILVIIIVATLGYMSIYANNPFSEIFNVSETVLNPNTVGRKVLNKQKVPAPDFQGIEQWLNTPNGDALTMEELRGKVVLIDFWTYSCINCQRTLPYITEWDRKYRDKGLVIVGVHTPEFNFEKSATNVLSAIEEYNIEYPVAQDNDYKTWRAYNNHFWPAKYFIDHEGNVVWQHFGEGAYEESERVIQQLLMDAGLMEAPEDIASDDVVADEVDHRQIGTPEIYFGHRRISNFGDMLRVVRDEAVSFPEPSSISSNTFYLVGDWKIGPEDAELVSDTGKIIIKYRAKKANIVFTSDAPRTAEVFLDGEYISEENAGSSVVVTGDRSTAVIDEDDLFNFVSTSEYEEHVLELRFSEPGVKAFAFTFG